MQYFLHHFGTYLGALNGSESQAFIRQKQNQINTETLCLLDKADCLNFCMKQAVWLITVVQFCKFCETNLNSASRKWPFSNSQHMILCPITQYNILSRTCHTGPEMFQASDKQSFGILKRLHAIYRVKINSGPAKCRVVSPTNGFYSYGF